MKKDTIIDIISKDIDELQTLLNDFRGEAPIPTSFIDLLKTKYSGIEKEIELLNYWSIDSANTTAAGDEKPKTETLATEPQPETGEQKTDEAPAPIQQDEAPEIIEEPIAEPATPAVPQAEVIVPNPTPIAPAPEEKPVTNAGPSAPKTSPKASDVTNYGTPVTDIRKAIAIADRFLFQKELFGGDADDFNAAMDIANTMESYEKAEEYLISNYGWDAENPTVQGFLRAVHRRYL